MIDKRFPDRGQNGRKDPPEATSLEELRQLLVGSERSRIDAVVERLEDHEQQVRAVAEVLPQAIRLKSVSDRDLSLALGPTIEETLEISVQREPQKLVKALSPVMMPAIRQSIISTVKGMIQSLNQTLEQSLSAQGLRWRLEALRTGRSFGEIVLLRTLLYRVEQVFLIDRETGLLMHHVSSGSGVEDADLVSGMLTAIQDFVRDSFGATEQALDALEVGDFTVWIERGPQAMLAAVIRGAPPIELRERLQRALEKIHVQFESELVSFDGNDRPLQACGPYLEDCCVESARPEKKKTGQIPLLAVLAVLFAVPLAWWAGSFWRGDGETWMDYVEALKREPGLQIVEAERSGDFVRIVGLRDPLARDPTSLMVEHGVDEALIRALWIPQPSAEPEFVLARARKALAPPETVELELRGGVLLIHGEAKKDWIQRADILGRTLPHLERLEFAVREVSESD